MRSPKETVRFHACAFARKRRPPRGANAPDGIEERERRTERRGRSECAMPLTRHGPPLGASLAAFLSRYRAALCLHARLAHGVSQLLAGTPSGPGRSPDTARVHGLRATRAGAAPCPTSTTPREAPFHGQGNRNIVKILEKSRAPKFDLPGFRPVPFDFAPNAARMNMRLSCDLLNAIKVTAASRRARSATACMPAAASRSAPSMMRCRRWRIYAARTHRGFRRVDRLSALLDAQPADLLGVRLSERSVQRYGKGADRQSRSALHRH